MMTDTRLRQREQELTALFSSARELAELRDGGVLLDRLVERAHEMMGSDLTYLSEFDQDSHELRVRTTIGSVSPEFRSLRVPAGRGLASVVVETGAPHWVERYNEYRADRHEADIDSAVAAEGIVSMLGVPMLSGSDVLGVLFVATREQHRFTAEQTALLSALADHASVALQTSRTLRDLQHSEDDARQALDRLTHHLAERDRSNTVHQRLVHAVLSGGGYEPLATTLADALGCLVWIVDEHGEVLACGGRADSEQHELTMDRAAAAAVAAAIAESGLSGHCVLVPGDSPIGAVSALVAGNQRFGAVLLGNWPDLVSTDPATAGVPKLGQVDRRTVERAAQVGTLLALQQAAVADAEHRVTNELVADLLDAVPERTTDVDRRVRRLGFIRHELNSLIVVGVAGDQRTAAARELAAVLGRAALVGEYQGYVVVVRSSDEPGAALAAAAELRNRLVLSLAVTVIAVVPPLNQDLAGAFDTARRTSRLLAALDVHDLATSTDEFLPYTAVLDTDGRTMRSFLDGTLGAVRQHDIERGTELVNTLRAFVRCNASPTKTARQLNFHTNTILQRLERLDGILGNGWREDERLFRLSLALRLDELRERLLGDSSIPRPERWTHDT